ncbi:hypothetical protein FPANT_10795 [Fusarium pseudoanthophilum]|uniref:Uncharacterized protein n=1 Tax=Fusarium pseudoanthophilum TaxID=48495 RepID=A0A8H5KQ18_9HYPO|nr:hypothetical protein FPANT_10795 [Fusarium pseudoanthophilum]
MVQLFLTLYPWILVTVGVSFTVFFAIQIVNRVPHRIYLLLIPCASYVILSGLHLDIYTSFRPHDPYIEELGRATALTSLLIITYTLVICFGCQSRGSQATESQKVRSSVPSTEIRDRQEDNDKTQKRSDITTKSDIPLWNPAYRQLKMLPSHNSSAGHAICEVCKGCEKLGILYEESFKTCHLGIDCTRRKSPGCAQHDPTTHSKRDSPTHSKRDPPTHIQPNSPTHLFVKTLDQFFSYRMGIVIWCMLIVFTFVPGDIHLLTTQSQHTIFLMREDGIVQLTVMATVFVFAIWLLLIPVVYIVRWCSICIFGLLRWFVLPVLYFCMARADPRISFFTACDNAIAIAQYVEEGSEWSKTSTVVGWLKEFGVAMEQAEQAEQARKRNKGNV